MWDKHVWPAVLQFTWISKLPKDIDEDICICSTALYIRSENTHYILIIWKIKTKCFKEKKKKKLYTKTLK